MYLKVVNFICELYLKLFKYSFCQEPLQFLYAIANYFKLISNVSNFILKLFNTFQFTTPNELSFYHLWPVEGEYFKWCIDNLLVKKKIKNCTFFKKLYCKSKLVFLHTQGKIITIYERVSFTTQPIRIYYVN